LRVLKMERVLQTLFYLLGYKRETICEPDTNKFDLKIAKIHISEHLVGQIGSYNPYGPRIHKIPEYQQLSFLKKNLATIDEDKIEEYSTVLAKVFRWIQTAIELRCEDVVARRDAVEFQKKDREDAINADAERTNKLEAAREEARAVSIFIS